MLGSDATFAMLALSIHEEKGDDSVSSALKSPSSSSEEMFKSGIHSGSSFLKWAGGRMKVWKGLIRVDTMKVWKGLIRVNTMKVWKGRMVYTAVRLGGIWRELYKTGPSLEDPQAL